MKWLITSLVLLALCDPGTAVAAEWELGLRGGTDATSVRENYRAAEVYLLYPLSWQAEVAGGKLRPRLDCGIGWIEAVGDNGGWLAAGADLVYALDALPLELEVGFRPTWLSNDDYGRDDFGGPLQFASHAGVALRLEPVTLSYRFQHLSNANIYEDNAGLDLHLFGCGVRF